MNHADVDIRVIHSGVGAISKSDLLMAMTGSKLVLGFNVTVMPKLDRWVKENGVEVRLYDVVYKLADDVKAIGRSMVQQEPEEVVTGRARVIAIFKSSHGAVIIGCEVLQGTLAVGKSFQVVTGMGPVYTGKIEALHIETRSVKEATQGQQVGIKLKDFKQAKVGDFIECVEMRASQREASWSPSGEILHFHS
ncbi:MAG: hypothetical protein ACLGPL_09580, partial [Acidobacteriota bacterium]